MAARNEPVTVAAATMVSDLEAVEADALIDDVTAELDEANGKVFAVRQRRYRDLPLRRARGGEVPAERAYELLQPLLAAEPWRWHGEQKDLRRLLDRMRWLGERVPELAFPADLDALVASAAMDLLTGNDLKALRDAKLQELLLAKLTGEQRRALVCPRCGGRRRVLAAITAPESIARVLSAMGLSSEAPELSPARSPPGESGDEWGG